MGSEDIDSIGWRRLPKILLNLEDSDTCDTDETEWLDDSFYQQAHIVSNLNTKNEIVKLWSKTSWLWANNSSI